MNHQEILSQMSLREKIAAASGKTFWRTKEMKRYGLPELLLCDGPHGLRRQTRKNDMLGIGPSSPATCFPAEVTLACSWDTELLARVGGAIAEEAASFGVSVVLGPGVNLKRNPLCGRNFEYFSEDPYLSGKLAASFILSMQETGVGASLKHFACNNQEYKRFNSDSIVDERTLRELYLLPFEIAVKEGRPATVMCAYNKLNGVHCSDNSWLLTQVLREEWGFEGLVVTDWAALNDRIEAFRAGCDLVMPGGSAYLEREALKAAKRGDLPEEDIDRSVSRLFCLAEWTSRREHPPKKADWEEHHALAVQAAQEGAVLLKNDGTLPLEPGTKTAVLGHMAREMRYQGAGSSHINPVKLVHPLDALEDHPFAPGYLPNGETTPELLAEAENLAREADAAVVFAGLPASRESESFDREELKMPEGHCRLIERVAAANPNTVVVLFSGGVVETPWADQVKAILYMGLPGQGGGEAAANLLYGRANPCGKLAESWPYRYEDCPSASYYGQKDAEYREGLYMGYRYYDKAGVKVRWPFGYGLSYTRFGYSHLEAGEDQVTAIVTNLGDRPGGEVAQLYLFPPEGGLHRPVRELKGFQKVYLKPGESRKLVFPLNRRSFALWDGEWKVPGGVYTVTVGGGGPNALSAAIRVAGEPVSVPEWQPGSWYERPAGQPSKEDWERMLGRKHQEESQGKGQFTMDHTILEMKGSSRLMGWVYRVMELFLTRVDSESAQARMALVSTVDSPLRVMQQLSGIRGGLFRCLLAMANGHVFRGIRELFRF